MKRLKILELTGGGTGLKGQFEFIDCTDYEGARLTNEVQHRYAPELRWARTTDSSTLMSG